VAFDQVINTTTLDYVDTANGEWEETDDSSTAVFIQLESEEDRWFGDPSAGTQNHAIMESELPTLEALVDSTKRGLRKLGAAGVIDNVFVDVESEDNARGFGSLYLTWRDRASSKAVDMAYAPLGGKP
jgi:hypothetical protein